MKRTESRYIELCCFEECPCGNGNLKKEYDFGMRDATVSTYTCGHAVTTSEATNFEGKGYFCKNYNDAAGIAKLIKMKAALPLA